MNESVWVRDDSSEALFIRAYVVKEYSDSEANAIATAAAFNANGSKGSARGRRLSLSSIIPNMSFGKGGRGVTSVPRGAHSGASTGTGPLPASDLLPFGLVRNAGAAGGNASSSKSNDKDHTYEVRRCDVYSYNSSHSDPKSDLSTASGLNEPAVLNILCTRFAQDKIYTRLDPLIISINPYKSIDGLCDFNRFSRLSVEDQHAHLFYAASRAFDALHQDRDASSGSYSGSGAGLNQAIAVSGESGAGKTEACKLLISYLIQRSGTGNSSSMKSSHEVENRLDTKLAACSPVLESFGNARTLHNENSSRFGKYLRLQINEDGCIVGAHVDHYLLERPRIVAQRDGERNYHVFYQLLASADISKSRNSSGGAIVGSGGRGPSSTYVDWAFHTRSWHLDADHNVYAFLGGGIAPPRQNIRKDADASAFEELCAALNNIGIHGSTQIELFRLLAAILQMGNVTFCVNHDDITGQSRSEALRTAEFDFVALVLAIPGDLGQVLTNKTVKSSGRTSFYSVPLNFDQAKSNTAALAKELYNRIFSWLVSVCNTTMAFRDHHRTMPYIGLLDIFGFEVFHENRFEQLCINFCNEKIQSLFNARVFELELARLVDEGVPIDQIQYNSCNEAISLLEGDQGVFRLIDEFNYLNKTSVEPSSVLESIDRVHLKIGNDKYIPKSYRPKLASSGGADAETFGVRHFAGDVYYSVTDFVAANGDRLVSDLAEMLLQSKNPIVKLINVAAQSDRNNDTSSSAAAYVAAATDLKQRRASIRGTALANQARKSTISAKFRENLNELMSELEATNVQFIRCIKPNKMQRPGVFDSRCVYSQLCHSGVMGVVSIRKWSFPIRLTWSELHNQLVGMRLYGSLGISTIGCETWSVARKRDEVLAIFNDALKAYPGLWYEGKSKVFMKGEIYQRLKQFQSRKSIILVQKAWRASFSRQKYRKFKRAVQQMQKSWRLRNSCKQLITARLRIQAFARMCLAMWVADNERRLRHYSVYLNRWRTIIRIRKHRAATLIRLSLERPKWRARLYRVTKAIRMLQNWVRNRGERLRYLRARRGGVKLGALWRGYRIRKLYCEPLNEKRVLIRARYRQNRASRISRFIRSAFYRVYIRSLFAAIRQGSIRTVTSLLRKLSKPAMIRSDTSPAPSAISSSASSGVSMSNASSPNIVTIPSANTYNIAGRGKMSVSTKKNNPNGFLPYGKLYYLKDISINEIRNSAEGFSTLLHVAAACGNEAIVQILLKQGCDPLARDSLRFAPLHRCVRLGGAGLAAMQALVDAQPNASVATDAYGRTPRAILEEKTSEQLSSDDWAAIALLKQAEGIAEDRLRKRMHREQYVRQVQARQQQGSGAAVSAISYVQSSNRESILNSDIKNADIAATLIPSAMQSSPNDDHESALIVALGSSTVDSTPPSSPTMNRSHSGVDLLRTSMSRIIPVAATTPTMHGKDCALHSASNVQASDKEQEEIAVYTPAPSNKSKVSGTGCIAIVDAIVGDGADITRNRNGGVESGYDSDSEILAQLSWRDRVDIMKQSDRRTNETVSHGGYVEYERLSNFADQYFTSDLKRLCREIFPSAVNIRKASRVLRILLELASCHEGLERSKDSSLSVTVPYDWNRVRQLPLGSSIEEADAEGILSYGEKERRFHQLTPNAHIVSRNGILADRSHVISEALRDGFITQWDTSSLLNVHAALSFKQYETELMSSDGFNGRTLHLEYDSKSSNESHATTDASTSASAIRGRMVVVPVENADSRASRQWEAFNTMVKDLEVLRSSTSTATNSSCSNSASDAILTTGMSVPYHTEADEYGPVNSAFSDGGLSCGMRKSRPLSLMSDVPVAVPKTTTRQLMQSNLPPGSFNKSRTSPSKSKRFRRYRSEQQRQLILQEARKEQQRKQLWALLLQPSVQHMQERQFWDTWTAYVNAMRNTPTTAQSHSETKDDSITLNINRDVDGSDEKVSISPGNTAYSGPRTPLRGTATVQTNIGTEAYNVVNAQSTTQQQSQSIPVSGAEIAATSSGTSSTTHYPNSALNKVPSAASAACLDTKKGTSSMLTDAKYQRMVARQRILEQDPIVAMMHGTIGSSTRGSATSMAAPQSKGKHAPPPPPQRSSAHTKGATAASVAVASSGNKTASQSIRTSR